MPEEAEVRGSDRSTPEGGAVTGETCKGAMAAVQGTGMAGSSTRKSKSVLVVGDDTDRLLVLANGKNALIKYNMARCDHPVCGNVKAAISFMLRRITEENTSRRPRSKFVSSSSG